MTQKKDQALKFEPVTTAGIGLSLERAEQADDEGNLHEVFRVVVSDESGNEIATHPAPRSEEAVTTAIGSLPQLVRDTLIGE